MSRVGKVPITVPSGVSVSVADGLISVNGAKGSLSQPLLKGISIKQEGDQLLINRDGNEQTLRATHGLMRSLVNNMIVGASVGYTKKLEIHGVGYRVQLSGQQLKFNLGFSHPVTYSLPAGVSAAVEQNVISISGFDKQKVGQAAAEIRALRKPEPYKGKGIRYAGERIIRKSGKSGKEK